MSIRELMQTYPEAFAKYAEKILDSYFGNIFVTYRNQKILYVNEKMARSIHMTKEELTSMSLEDLRKNKFWLRSLSQELYACKKPFNAYNVSKWGNELFTRVEPIFDEAGEVLFSVQYSIPKNMLTEFSQYIDTEHSRLSDYKTIAEYLSNRKDTTDELICESAAAKAAFSEARHLSQMDSIVLICGETGTGKDILANYIYRHSRRSDKPFIPVNCSAIPAELVESEFFGYERGAFTGARSSGKPGLFEMANHGTLFLDEVGELPLPMQAKLLRALETGDTMRVGGTNIIHTDVRVIAATNRDLRQMVQEGRFREDLYYRLNVVPIHLPPLRERTADILPLANLFLSKNNQKYGLARTLTPDMQETLLHYHWPGNIRELRNVIECFAISGRFDLSLLFPQPGPRSDGADPSSPSQTNLPLHEACARFEAAYLKQALDACGGNVSKAAQALGIHRSLLYKKLKKAHLNPSDSVPHPPAEL